MKKEDLIRNLKAELTKLEETKKTYDTFETRYDLMIEDVLDYIENSISKKKIEDKKNKIHKEYINILSEYGNIDSTFDIPNKNVRKHLDELILEIMLLQELLEDK